MAELAQRAERGAPGWRLLVTEFRVHAARDPELNRRYAALHARTVDGIAEILAAMSEGGPDSLPFPPRQLAELVLALETGVALEQLANADALGGPALPVLDRLSRWLGLAPVPTGEAR